MAVATPSGKTADASRAQRPAAGRVVALRHLSAGVVDAGNAFSPVVLGRVRARCKLRTWARV